MSRNIVSGIVALAFLVYLGYSALNPNAFAQPVMQEFTASISASQVSTSQNFGFAATNVYIRNLDSANEVFVSIQDATATTSHLRLNAGQAVELTLGSPGRARLISAICSSGETAIVAVAAWN